MESSMSVNVATPYSINVKYFYFDSYFYLSIFKSNSNKY